MADIEQKVLDLVGEVIGLTELDEFRRGLLTALRTAIPSDWASLNDIGPEPDDVTAVADPPVPPDLHAAFARLAHENPLVRNIDKTGDGRPYRFSDFVSTEELHATALYREVYMPLRVEHQVAFTLPCRPTRILGVALSRERPDYTDADCELLTRARPFLVQAFRNAVEQHRLRRLVEGTQASSMAEALTYAGLTPRESEAISLVAHGSSNAAVADQLGISPRTVQKHLERAFAKLGVKDRSSAAARAWELTDRLPERAALRR